MISLFLLYITEHYTCHSNSNQILNISSFYKPYFYSKFSITKLALGLPLSKALIRAYQSSTDGSGHAHLSIDGSYNQATGCTSTKNTNDGGSSKNSWFQLDLGKRRNVKQVCSAINHTTHFTLLRSNPSVSLTYSFISTKIQRGAPQQLMYLSRGMYGVTSCFSVLATKICLLQQKILLAAQHGIGQLRLSWQKFCCFS